VAFHGGSVNRRPAVVVALVDVAARRRHHLLVKRGVPSDMSLLCLVFGFGFLWL
jgi:hypothetical protein